MKLSPREKEVFKACIINGMHNRDAGKTLFLAPTTVQRHLANIRQKLGVSGGKGSARLVVVMLREAINKNIITVDEFLEV